MSAPAPLQNDAACDALSSFLERLSCLGTAEAMDTLAASELTFTQFRALFVVSMHDAPMPVHEIAECVDLSIATAGRTVDRLVQAGLVDRREDPGDRRVKLVTLTDQGRETVEKQLDIKRDLVGRFIDGLPDEFRAALTSALRNIVDADVDYFTLDRESSRTRTATPSTSEPKDPS
ncbi:MULTISPECIES: MarR family winged helix-turn-helix transcriptional regulator [Gordonia]|uniref:Putative MarR family transcriptional regulator n=2 Tax=Gordonia TaxID=2053 RepID=H5U3S4_9ACTN|nr:MULTISPECIES: MarR family transcriptional regulator [Gordonia]MCM3894636.1 MarR family transcriptional regulator [Gordonia sputi]NKY92580.1 MarR family transcriptional regulator [Gordonia sputi]OBA43105.1 transcriptional regulator [Gordonia sp. 852002-51296_SCH5728562-b]GAB40382.1 putative MarR family transcriptional regulator [Gordonia sputi NBRC 100414]